MTRERRIRFIDEHFRRGPLGLYRDLKPAAEADIELAAQVMRNEEERQRPKLQRVESNRRRKRR